MLFASANDSIAVYDQKTLSILGRFVIPSVDKKNIACKPVFKRSSNHICAVKGQHVFAYTYSKEQPFRKSVLHDALTSFECTRDGNFYFGGAHNGSIYVWDVSTGDCLRIFDAHLKKVSFMKVSEHQLITAGNDAVINVWNIADLVDEEVEHVEPFRSFNEHSMPITGLQCEFSSRYSNEVRLYTCSADKTFKVYDLNGGECVLTLLLPEEPTAIVVSLTVAYIALKSGNIIAFNLITMGFDSSIDTNGPVSLEVLEEHTDTMKHHKNTVTSLCLNASGDKLFSSDTKGVLAIWDLESNQMIKTLDTGFEILQLESGLKQINLFMQSKNAPAAISPVLARTNGSTAEQNVLCEMELYSVDDLLQVDTSHLPVSSSSNGSKDKQLQLENEELKLKYASLSDLYSKMTKMAGQALSKSADEVVDR